MRNILLSRPDYKVKFVADDDISAVCRRLWRRFCAEGVTVFPIVSALERCQKEPISKNGLLTVSFFHQTAHSPPARVRFDPLTLIVDDECWSFARQGDPSSKWILAHELGHIILHDKEAKAFSNDPGSRLKFTSEQESGESQADMFAFHQLMPDWLINHFQKNVAWIARHCDVDEEIARARIAIFERRWKNHYTGPTDR